MSRRWTLAVLVLAGAAIPVGIATNVLHPDDCRESKPGETASTAAIIAACTRRVELDRGDGRAYYLRALALMPLYDFKFVDDLDRAVAADPTLAEAFALRASVRWAQARNAEALADFDAAIRLAPTEDNYRQRGFYHKMQQNWERAIADYSAAITLNPHRIANFVDRAEALEWAGRIDEGQRDRARIRELDPSGLSSLNRSLP